MSVTNVATGGGTALMSTGGRETSVIRETLDLSANALASPNVIRLVNVPALCPVDLFTANITTPDSVAAGTIDIGFFKQSDDTELDADGIANELAVGAEAKAGGALAGGTYCPLVDAYIGISRGAGGSGELNDAVIEFAFRITAMN